MKNTITACLSRPIFSSGKVEANLDQVESILQKYESQRIDLHVFPEVCISGGFIKNGGQIYKNIAEKVPTGTSAHKLIQLANKYNTHICAGIFEKGRNCYFATHFVVGPNGFIGKQRKLFPFNPTKPSILSSGKKLSIIPILDHSAVLMPCADSLLPEPLMQAGILKPSLVLCPMDTFYKTNFLSVDTLLRARALELGAFLLAVFTKPNKNNGTAIDYIVYSPKGHDIPLQKEKDSALLKLDLADPVEIWGGFIKRNRYLKR